MSLKDKIADLRSRLQGSGDENVKAFGSGFIFIALLIIGVIALFLDIIFVTMIWNALPGGFLRIFAAGGAILVSPVVILILLAKLFYFRKGGQLIFSYVAFAVDLIFAALNTYCAFQLAWGKTDSFVITWRDLSPVTPCVILVLLAILLMIDPNAKRLNKIREHKEKVRDLELDYEYEEKERAFALKQLDAELKAAQQEAAIDVKMSALEEYKTLLKEEVLSPESLAHLREGARRLRDETVHTLTGLPRGIAAQPGRATHTLANGDEIAVYAPNQQIAQQKLNEEVQMFQPLDTSNLDTGKYMSLLDKAVQYGQISEEEASPLRQALGKTQAKHQSNGKQ